MNRILLLVWLYGLESDLEESATKCFNSLRNGIEQGKKFPFDCPYQVTLIHNPMGPEWIVAILAMRGTQGDDSTEQNEILRGWLHRCQASDGQDRGGYPVRGGTVQSSLNPKWEYIDSFGTIQEKAKSWWRFWQ